MSGKFTRKKEDFTCKNCGFFVVGDGYTNHCPKCLYSMHVDINPGDREETCGSLMKPFKVEMIEGKYVVYQKCLKCGFVRKNKVSKDDDFEQIVILSKQ
jgi:rubrerythrin